jgi:hypothetical protein
MFGRVSPFFRSIASVLVASTLTSASATLRAQPAPRVQIDADAPVVLQRAEGTSWVDVCKSPCNAPVAANHEYRIDGVGVRPTPRFSLPPASEELTLNVKTHSSAAFGVGIAGIALGGTIMALGGMAMAVGGLSGSYKADEAWATFGAGAVTLLLGFILMATGASSSRVTTSDVARRAGSLARF